MSETTSARPAGAIDLVKTIDMVPESQLKGKARGHLQRMAATLDNAVREEEAGVFKIHEPTLRSFLRERDIFGAPDFEERTIARLRHGDLLTSSARGKKVQWAEFLKQGANLDIPGSRGLHPDAFTSNEKLEQGIRRLYPDLPPEALDRGKMNEAIGRFLGTAGGIPGAERAEGAEGLALADFASWWDCVMRKYASFWIGVVGFALMCFVVTFPNLLLGAFFAGLWLGATALYVGLSCLFNPWG